MICSGKSNFAICDNRISVNLRELENYIADEIDKMLKEAPPDEIIPATKEFSAEILSIEQKIERLVNALAESGDIAVSYITKQIEVLHKQRDELMKQSRTEPAKISKLDFKSLSFDDKKIIAAEFIDRILMSGKNVNIVWKI